MKNIVDTVLGMPLFSTFARYMKSGGLVETLNSPGPFTLFAPTNDAFAKMSIEYVAELEGDNKRRLTTLLRFHIASGKMTLKSIARRKEIETLQGKTLSIRKGEDMLVSDARVEKGDIVCRNGIIHAIDTVLIP
jgi:uncharacterized surface protein with fasciclin (FAS1) repeats